MRIQYFIMTLLLCFISPCGSARAQDLDVEPFATANRHPLIAVFGLPDAAGTRVVDQGRVQMRLTLEGINTYAADSSPQERVILDAEVWRLTLSGRLGIGRRAEVGLDLPFMLSSGGILDQTIENYHGIFGLQNGGRDRAPRSRILVRYEKNGITLLNMDQSGQGIGDARLTGGWQLYRSADSLRNLTLRASLKLPTGEVGNLYGSGSVDLAVWASGSIGHAFRVGRLAGYGSLGVLGMSRGRVLADLQNPVVGFATLGVALSPLPGWDLKVQTDAHTPFYRESRLRQLGATSAQLTFGGSYRFSASTALDVAMSQDIVVETAPDVVFHLSLRHTF